MTTTTANLPPGPRQRFPGETLIAYRSGALNFLSNLQREYGDIVAFRVGPEQLLLVSRPEWIAEVLVNQQRKFTKSMGLQAAKRVIGEGLLTSEGEFHLRQRRLVQPAFHRQRIASYAATMVEYAAQTRQRWQHGATIDLDHEMTQLTLAIVGKTLFDAEVGSEAAQIGTAMNELMLLFPLATLPFYKRIEHLPVPMIMRGNAASATLDRLMYRLIAERRASGEDRGDLLSMLLLAQDDQDGGGMSDQQVRDEALTLFLAGHETTANLMIWTFYLLAQHGTVRAQLEAEIDTVLGRRLPSFEDVPQLPFTRQVIAESMRLYPPAWVVGRRAISDAQLGDYTIPAGSTVLTSQWVVHHDPRWFPDPLRFDPTRWTPEAQAARPKFRYFPFGGGTRLCIGEQFAW
ncbi:MAG: cytochrome P450, partial [Roseiflexaceae bacterium]|nr:cytochrome P450 [Roseiflexaceae bacterium]